MRALNRPKKPTSTVALPPCPSAKTLAPSVNHSTKWPDLSQRHQRRLLRTLISTQCIAVRNRLSQSRHSQ